jgi:hypothetical protein
VALSQARILYQNHSGDYPQVILTIPVTCRTTSYATYPLNHLDSMVKKHIMLLYFWYNYCRDFFYLRTNKEKWEKQEQNIIFEKNKNHLK